MGAALARAAAPPVGEGWAARSSMSRRRDAIRYTAPPRRVRLIPPSSYRPRLGLPGSSSCTAHTLLADFRHHSPALIPGRREHSTPPVPAPHARSPSHRTRATCSATCITLEQRQHEYSSSPHARRSRPSGRSSYSPPAPVPSRGARARACSPLLGSASLLGQAAPARDVDAMEGRARAQERKAYRCGNESSGRMGLHS
ncbi:hypothetical protein DFH09DRAFT_163309 [Mycena vulgaris]|nr:hypothetical protein DFH09DRAFT_163309 [Mycena vulgaris]